MKINSRVSHTQLFVYMHNILDNNVLILIRKKNKQSVLELANVMERAENEKKLKTESTSKF